MLLEITPTDGGYKLNGELDLATAEELRVFLVERQPDRTVTLDFSGVSFMDSSGLRVLLEAVRSMDGDGSASLVIMNPKPHVKRVFEITLPEGVPGLEVRT